MQIRTFHSYHPQHKQLYEEIFSLTQSSKDVYPNYEKWYREKFIQGLIKKERMYIIAWDEEKDILAGCALLKKSLSERKLCSLFVRHQYRGQGIGRQLVQQTLKELGEIPLVTVSSRNISVASFFKKCGFHLSAVKNGVYQSNDSEYYFNDEKADAVRDGLIPVLRQRMKQLKQK